MKKDFIRTKMEFKDKYDKNFITFIIHIMTYNALEIQIIVERKKSFTVCNRNMFELNKKELKRRIEDNINSLTNREKIDLIELINKHFIEFMSIKGKYFIGL